MLIERERTHLTDYLNGAAAAELIRGAIASWCAGLDNVLPPLALDVTSADWPVDAADAVLCINMAHVSP